MATTLAPLVEEHSPSLGKLMCAHRTDHGESIRTVSRRCALAPADIALVELDRADIDNEQLAAVVRAYDVPRTRFPVDLSQLVVDLVSGGVSVRPRLVPVEESSTDALLLVYLELLFASKDLPATTDLTFTSLDLDLVRLMLSSRSEEVSARLDELILPVRPTSPLQRPSTAKTYLVGAAAATVALLITIAIGSPRTTSRPSALGPDPIVATVLGAETEAPQIDPRNPAASDPAGVAVPIEIKIIDPLVVTRLPDGSTTSGDSSTPVEPPKETK